MIRYGKTSLANIATLAPRMQRVCHAAIGIMNRRKLARPDFGISSGRRTAIEQNILYQQGRTTPGNIITYRDGYLIKSMHQTGRAIDFFAYVSGRGDYDPGLLAMVAMCFAAAATEHGLDWEWGGNFESLVDGAHFECL
jgi:peptidoglycan L-alanyl-D-glutamate endopeptidase CwlK